MKEKEEDWKGFYTDAPDLRPGYVRPFLQILGWIFFHPSAWRSYVTSVDPALDPALPLIQITRAHLAAPRLQRLLLVLVWLPALVWIGSALAYPGVAQPLGPALDESIIAHIYEGATEFAYRGATEFAIAWLIFGPAAAASLVLGHVVAWEITYFSGFGDSIPITHDLLAYELGLGLCMAIAGVTGRPPARSSRGRFVGAALLGLVMGAVFRNGTLLPLAYLKLHGGSVLAHCVTTGLIAAVLLGLVTRAIGTPKRAAYTGVLVGVAIGVAEGLSMASKHADVVLFSWTDGMSYGLAFLVAGRLGGLWAGVLGASLGEVVATSGDILTLRLFGFRPARAMLLLHPTDWVWKSLGIVVGLTFNLWRPILLYPALAAWNTILFFLDQRGPADAAPRLRYHSAFWDEHQRLRLSGLDDHIVLIHERRPAEAEAALAYLSNSRQRWAVRAVQIELDLVRLERCKSPEDIAATAARTSTRPDEPGDFQRNFERIAEDTTAALAQASNINRRLGLRAARDRLDPLIRDLRLSRDPLAARFQAIAATWSKLLDARIEDLATEAELAQEIENPYIIAVPLTEDVPIYIARTEIGAEIEQLILDKRKPPLLLYGQRRMGKTSLLQNLGKLLRSDLVPLYVDLQGPAGSAAQHSGFLFNLARSAVTSARRFRNLALPPLTEQSLAADPFTRFDVWLDEVEAALGERSALLVFDEIEALERAFQKGRFEEDLVLGMLRNLIQHRPRFKVLLAGSQSFDELVRWSSYLINARTVRLGYLTESEAKQLIETPIPEFPLRYEPEARDRVLGLTRGHPFLVQLLCGEIVTHMNGLPPERRRLATPADVEAAVLPALQRGELYFGEVETKQAESDGAAFLRRLADKGEGALLDEATLTAGSEHAPELIQRLLRREILEQEGDAYRFKVELVRRWFASRRPVIAAPRP